MTVPPATAVGLGQGGGPGQWSLPSLGYHSANQHFGAPLRLGRGLKGGAPPEPQSFRGTPPSSLGPPAEAISQLCLDSWRKCESDHYSSCIICYSGRRLQPPFSRILMTTSQEPSPGRDFKSGDFNPFREEGTRENRIQ